MSSTKNKKDYFSEDKIIRSCCQTNFSDRIRQLLNERLDWMYMLRKAGKEDVSSLLYYNLSKIPGIVPEDCINELKKDYYNITAYNLILNREFAKITRLFGEENIPVIPLKGIALIQGIYPDIGLRRMGDIDLLVKREDAERAFRVLERVRYSCFNKTNIPEGYSPYINSVVSVKHEKDYSVSMHIHWHLVNTTLPLLSVYKINMDEIWTESEKWHKDTLMMAPHHFILYLCLHAFHHSFERLILLCDIKEALRFYAGRIDWDKLIYYADKYNIKKIAYPSLYFCGLNKFGVNGDSAPHQIIRNTALNAGYFVYLSMAYGIINKIKFIWLTLFPPKCYICQIKQIKPEDVNLFYYFKRLYQAFYNGAGILRSLLRR